ncbi:MAG: TonB-dependent receptor [Bacteroidia bacterium]|jgi:iron complex outermembrane receptor protein|nr:TonB-dependent receptor [Bacteroidia bacterium]
MKNTLFSLAVLWIPLCATAQLRLSGTVSDPNGQPVSFAAVQISGTFSGAITNAAGQYQLLNLSRGTYSIKASCLGYTPEIKTITLNSDTVVNFQLTAAAYLQQEVVVQSTRANANSAMASTEVSKDDLAQVNYGQDLPILLNLLPSVVTTSDAGAGVGYTGIRIRGTDASRINVTINGIPVNDAESQGVFWVNMPDFASSVQSIQVQRGVGTSTNGAGAFGGSVNMQTDDLRDSAYTDLVVSAGSFNTRRVSFKTGTGLIKKHWAFDGRLSRISSDGFIDRASSELQSWYGSGGWYGDRFFVKAVVFSGNEKTYQAWYGVPEDSVRAGNYTYNPAGEIYTPQGNVIYYDNETDNYRQTHYQLISAYTLSPEWTLNTALHATRGLGYYEQYRAGETFAEYNLPDYISGNDTISTTDLVRRLWLDNWFYGLTFSLNGRINNRWQIVAGGAANQYNGDHYGTVEWTQAPLVQPRDFKYYFNNGLKNDITVYLKSNWQATKTINLFGDVQARYVSYTFEGFDRNANNVTQEVSYFFLNPKAGVTFTPNDAHSFYASVSVGNKEPNRDDLTESSPESRPKHETLYDGEAGWKYTRRKLRAGVNLYYMYYINQLVVTGKLNDVGAYTRQNVDRSYRAGVELEAAWQPFKKLGVAGNLTLSQNRILDFEEFVDDFDNGGQVINKFAETDIALSPAVVAAAQLNWMPAKPLLFTLTAKHVGRQYLDNTTNTNRSIDPFTVSDFRAQWKFPVKEMRELTLGVQVNNLLNLRYSNNGYTFGFIAGGPQQFNYFFPQAGRNFMIMLTARF